MQKGQVDTIGKGSGEGRCKRDRYRISKRHPADLVVLPESSPDPVPDPLVFLPRSAADQRGRWSLPGANGIRERLGVSGWRFGRRGNRCARSSARPSTRFCMSRKATVQGASPVLPEILTSTQPFIGGMSRTGPSKWLPWMAIRDPPGIKVIAWLAAGPLRKRLLRRMTSP